MKEKQVAIRAQSVGISMANFYGKTQINSLWEVKQEYRIMEGDGKMLWDLINLIQVSMQVIIFVNITAFFMKVLPQYYQIELFRI